MPRGVGLHASAEAGDARTSDPNATTKVETRNVISVFVFLTSMPTTLRRDPFQPSNFRINCRCIL
jgi:hypothetical protein